MRGLMRRLRASWRALRVLLHLLHGLALLALRLPLLDEAARRRRVQGWSARLLRLAGLQRRVSGTPRPGATLDVVAIIVLAYAIDYGSCGGFTGHHGDSERVALRLGTPLRSDTESEWQDFLTDDSADQETMLAERDEMEATIREDAKADAERFYRTENPLKVEAGGTGLGLSLVRPR